MGVEQAGTWDLSLDELAYNNREEVHRNYITDNSQYEARAFNDCTVTQQGIKESMVQTNRSRDESELVGREDDSRGVNVCNGTTGKQSKCSSQLTKRASSTTWDRPGGGA